MAFHNNDILILHYEDLPDGDKGIISKATEEFQNKCLLSYTKTRDNTIVQKFPLQRVLLHGHTDTNEAEDRRFFKEVVDKSIRDAISSHNEAFVNIFHNIMRGDSWISSWSRWTGLLQHFRSVDPRDQSSRYQPLRSSTSW